MPPATDYQPLPCPALATALDQLPLTGKLTLAQAGLLYLDISDDYIHQGYPHIEDPHKRLPNYFAETLEQMGAHISVIYPEEINTACTPDLGQIHHFSVHELHVITVRQTRYYALRVQAPSLLAIRKQQQLTEQLALHGCTIPFLHITLAKATVT